ncbi:MAG: acylneuraminate cytidylyltransferase family protein [Sphingobacteriaceae bacterium]
MKSLFLIPARGGSKGFPKKNTALLAGIPLIHYSIAFARCFTTDAHICVSSDSEEIIACANQIGLHVPFVRPQELATDTSPTYDSILHAIQFYQNQGQVYDTLVLLQPTSPFRRTEFLKEAFLAYNNTLDMVVSVVESHANPYFNLFEENHSGFLFKSKSTNATRRQDCPIVYQYNGSIYVMNTQSLKRESPNQFSQVIKYAMPPAYSVDIDSKFDFDFCTYLLEKRSVQLDFNI